jgi:hypothetical protein
MAYNTNQILKDVNGNTIPQYYNPTLDIYEPLVGDNGGTKTTFFDKDGNELISTQVVQPIVDKLDELIGTALAEENRSVFEEYNNSKQYYLGNKVSYQGSSYRCISNSLGNLPTNETYWLLIASGMLWKGEYDALTEYYPTNLVGYSGETYICNQTSTGNLPTDPTYFTLFAGISGLSQSTWEVFI